MKKTLLNILALGLVATSVFAQNPTFEWVKQMGGTSVDLVYSITTDINGNVYTTGSFFGTVDFDPGSGTSILYSTGRSDIFIQKLDSDGNFLWVKQIGGIDGDAGLSITTDVIGYVYITGRFELSADFDPGFGTSNLISVGEYDIFILKLDPGGNFIWAKQMGGTDNDYVQSITTDVNGNIYSTGKFQLTADFDPDSGTSNLISVGYSDIFIQKLDSDGNFLWAKQMGGWDDDAGLSIIIDVNGYVYTTGHFRGTVDFDPGIGTSSLTSAGFGDIFIQKLDSNGNFLWAKQMGGTWSALGNSITTDAIGNVYTTGYFRENVDFDPGPGSSILSSAGDGDIFIQKLDPNGNFLWVKQMGGIDRDNGESITVDTNGNVYTTGYFSGISDFDPGPGSSILSSAGDLDIFIQKLDPNGNFLWAKQMGGTDSDYGKSINIDAIGNVYTTGYFHGTGDFDPCAGMSSFTSVGISDIFIQKLSQNSMTGLNEGLNEISKKQTIVYPNPSTGKFTLDLGNVKAESVIIYDIRGKIVESISDVQIQSFDLNVSAGMYFMKIQMKDRTEDIIKLIVQ